MKYFWYSLTFIAQSIEARLLTMARIWDTRNDSHCHGCALIELFLRRIYFKCFDFSTLTLAMRFFFLFFFAFTLFF